ncbi:hypothetical protein LZ32DRAFT_623132 [Colletotrichum eremochloae]|nr:hypothetical protein LZ32DRAFT_623132 [Colletotrichum eremochloae]
MEHTPCSRSDSFHHGHLPLVKKAVIGGCQLMTRSSVGDSKAVVKDSTGIATPTCAGASHSLSRFGCLRAAPSFGLLGHGQAAYTVPAQAESIICDQLVPPTVGWSSASTSNIRASSTNKQQHQHAWLQPDRRQAHFTPPSSSWRKRPSGKAAEGADEHDEPATSADGGGPFRRQTAADVGVNKPNIGRKLPSDLPAAGSPTLACNLSAPLPNDSGFDWLDERHAATRSFAAAIEHWPGLGKVDYVQIGGHALAHPLRGACVGKPRLCN